MPTAHLPISSSVHEVRKRHCKHSIGNRLLCSFKRGIDKQGRERLPSKHDPEGTQCIGRAVSQVHETCRQGWTHEAFVFRSGTDRMLACRQQAPSLNPRTAGFLTTKSSPSCSRFPNESCNHHPHEACGNSEHTLTRTRCGGTLELHHDTKVQLHLYAINNLTAAWS